jgi:hypothetical protein
MTPACERFGAAYDQASISATVAKSPLFPHPATAILVAITRATKGAFCKMAAEDAKKAISARAK